MPPNAILCISGSELTRGETKDLNGPFLAAELAAVGVRVDEVLLVPDEPELLLAAVEHAVGAADIVILSGGLGPTRDDHTVSVLSLLLGRSIYRHPKAEANMLSRAMARGLTRDRLPENYWKQAEVIEGAEVLLNPVGLAPGMLLSTKRGILAVLPGVPGEMQAIFRKYVLESILRTFQLMPPRMLRVKILGIPESLAESRIVRLGIDFGRIEYGISARPGELLVRFISNRLENHEHLATIRALLEREFGDDLLIVNDGPVDSSALASSIDHAALVHSILLRAGVTVATAESCTGGLIAKQLTDHPGSSAYFLGGVVAYDNRTKESLLGIPSELLRTQGAVCEEVCGAMAMAILQKLGADYGMSTTGIAGPSGGTPEKPVGLVYVGLAGRGPADLLVERHLFWGNRENVRTLTAVRALDLLRRNLASIAT